VLHEGSVNPARIAAIIKTKNARRVAKHPRVEAERMKRFIEQYMGVFM